MFIKLTLHHFFRLGFVQFLDFLSLDIGWKLRFYFNLSLWHGETVDLSEMKCHTCWRSRHFRVIVNLKLQIQVLDAVSCSTTNPH